MRWPKAFRAPRINSLARSEDVKLLATRMDFLATKDDIHAVQNRMLRWILGAEAFQVIAVIIALYLHK